MEAAIPKRASPFFKVRRERPEQEFQILLVRTRLEPMVKAGKLLTYFAVPNELVGMLYQTKPWASQLAVKMGVKRGVTDFVLISYQGAAFMELKSEDGTLSQQQEEFRDNVKAAGLPWFLVRTVEQFDLEVGAWLV